MTGPVVNMLTPDEADAVILLRKLEAEHDGLTILEPAYRYQRWRAEFDEGSVPGAGRTTSGSLTARLPSRLLAKLRAEFADSDPVDDTG